MWGVGGGGVCVCVCVCMCMCVCVCMCSLVPRPFFPIIILNVRGRGKKRPGIHCTGGSACALNC